MFERLLQVSSFVCRRPCALALVPRLYNVHPFIYLYSLCPLSSDKVAMQGKNERMKANGRRATMQLFAHQRLIYIGCTWRYDVIIVSSTKATEQQEDSLVAFCCQATIIERE